MWQDRLKKKYVPLHLLEGEWSMLVDDITQLLKEQRELSTKEIEIYFGLNATKIVEDIYTKNEILNIITTSELR